MHARSRFGLVKGSSLVRFALWPAVIQCLFRDTSCCFADTAAGRGASRWKLRGTLRTDTDNEEVQRALMKETFANVFAASAAR